MSSVTFNGRTVEVPNLSCASVTSALTKSLNAPGWTAASCNGNPVQSNTVIYFVYQSNGSVNWEAPITALFDSGSSDTVSPQTIASAYTTEPFDYDYAVQVWGAAFSVTIGLYLIAFKVGAILKLFSRL